MIRLRYLDIPKKLSRETKNLDFENKVTNCLESTLKQGKRVPHDQQGQVQVGRLFFRVLLTSETNNFASSFICKSQRWHIILYFVFLHITSKIWQPDVFFSFFFAKNTLKTKNSHNLLDLTRKIKVSALFSSAF